MKKTIVIKTENISKSYINGKIQNLVLKNLSLEIYSGELTIIIGPSGSGKTTLLSIISGLAEPDSGVVLINGIDLWKQPKNKIDSIRLKTCGFIFQGFNLFASLNALQQILILLKYLNTDKSKSQDIAMQALAEVGMKEKHALFPQELSGGEKQRVAIARAMVKKPKILFADEPTSNLDKENGINIVKLLQKEAVNNDTAIIAVTHDSRLLDYADRIIQIEDGNIISDKRINNESSVEK